MGDLVRGLIMGIIGVAIWLVGVINLLASPHDPPSRGPIGLDVAWAYGALDLDYQDCRK